MEQWDEHSEKVSRIRPDKEKAKSLLKIVELREKDLKSKDKKEFATLIVEGYYEIIKELITGIMSIDGYKTISHELLIAYMDQFYKEFSSAELYVMDNLRKTRNDIAYRGVLIPLQYLERDEKEFIAIIVKLKKIVSTKLIK